MEQKVIHLTTTRPHVLIALIMEPVSTSEMSVNVYQNTRRNNPEDSHLHTRSRENLKSHLKNPCSVTVHGRFLGLWTYN
jgi:hypothetical protein